MVVEINSTVRYQTVEGFGCSQAFRMADVLLQYPKEERAHILDLLFSPDRGIGLSMVRSIIGDAPHDRSKQEYGAAHNGPIPSIWPCPDKSLRTDGDEGQIEIMREAMKRGCTSFIATAWSPPAWMKTNGSTIHGGRLNPTQYANYADYLAQYALLYGREHGIEMTGISPANEPGNAAAYSSCLWTGTELCRFVRDYMRPAFDRHGVSAKILLGEDECFGESLLTDTLQDDKACRAMDVACTHGYDLRAEHLPMCERCHKPIWLTEISQSKCGRQDMDEALLYARLLSDHLTVTGVSAWLYWWGAAQSSSGGSTLIRLHPDRETYDVYKKLFAIGQFSRFIRPGAIRIAAACEGGVNIPCSAFMDASGYIVLVLVNNGGELNVRVNLPGSDSPFISEMYVTDETRDMRRVPLHDTAGRSLQAVIPPRSVASIKSVPSYGSRCPGVEK